MLIGYLGEIPFRVSKSSIVTFDDYSRSASGRWTEHAIIGAKPLAEYLGPELEQITFKIQLRRDLGADVETLLEKLRRMRDAGTPVPLIISNKLINSNNWTVQSLTENVTHWGRGFIMSCTVSLTLKEYAE